MDRHIINNMTLSIKNINDLKSTCEIFSGMLGNENFSDKERELYRKVINKVFIIDLYSIWEQFVKKCISEIYDEYRHIFLSNKIVINRAFNEKIKRARDIKFDDSGAVKFKDLIVSTNNMKYKAFKECISSIGIDINLFYSTNNIETIKDNIESLKNGGLGLLDDPDFTNERNIYLDIINSIYTIVFLRNEYAHTGRASLFLDIESQMKPYCDLFIEIIKEISNFLSQKLRDRIYEFYSCQRKTIVLTVLEVLYENTGEQDSSSLRILSSKRIPNGYNLFIKHKGRFYDADLEKIEDLNEEEMRNIRKGEQYIVIKTKFKIRKSKINDIVLFSFKHVKDYAYVKFV